VKELTWCDDVLVNEELLVQELSDAVGSKLDGSLWMRKAELSWSTEELSCEKNAFIVSV